MSIDTLVVIPCFNEADSILNLIEEAKPFSHLVDFLFINDGSTDGTEEILKQANATYISLPVNLGIGGSVQTGIIYALRNNYNFCMQLDGDGQHPPKYIESMITYMREKDCDILIGSRNLIGTSTGTSVMRSYAGKFLSYVLNVSFKNLNCTDPTSGYRILNRKAIGVYADNYPKDYPEPIALAIAHKKNLLIKEFHVQMRERKTGRSSISKIRSITYMFRVIAYILLWRFSAKRG